MSVKGKLLVLNGFQVDLEHFLKQKPVLILDLILLVYSLQSLLQIGLNEVWLDWFPIVEGGFDCSKTLNVKFVLLSALSFIYYPILPQQIPHLNYFKFS